MGRKYKVLSIDAIDWEKTPIIEGVISGIEPMEVEGKERLTMVINTATSRVRVWHSAALQEAFTLGAQDDNIRIEFQGKISLKGGHTFNRFSVAVWTGADDEKEKPEPEASTPKA